MQSNKLLIYKIRNYENEVKNIVIDNILLTDLSVIVESVLSGDINIDEFFEVPTNYNKSKKIKKSFKDKFNLFLSYYKQYKNSEEDLKRILRFFNISKSLVFLVCEKFEFLDSNLIFLKKVKYLKNEIRKLKNYLIENNMSLVNHIACSYNYKGIFSLMDLIQEGVLGLIKSINIIDCNQNIELSTYSYYWINYYISLFLFKKNNFITLPVHLVKKLNKVKKISQLYLEENSKMPNLKELSELTGIKENELQKLEKHDLKVHSYDISDNSNLFNYIGDSSSEEQLYSFDLKNIIKENLSKLNEFERLAVVTEFKLDYIDVDKSIELKDRKKYLLSALRKLKTMDNWEGYDRL